MSEEGVSDFNFEINLQSFVAVVTMNICECQMIHRLIYSIHPLNAPIQLEFPNAYEFKT